MQNGLAGTAKEYVLTVEIWNSWHQTSKTIALLHKKEPAVSAIFEKISSYNLLNNLVPGVLFCVVVTELTRFDLVYPDVVLGLFLYYFAGMIISRVGSLLIEPALAAVHFLPASDHSAYIRAETQDSKIAVLLEQCNMYRTVTSMLLHVLVATALDETTLSPHIVAYTALGFLLVLFAFAYRKQREYVTQRVDFYSRNKEAQTNGTTNP